MSDDDRLPLCVDLDGTLVATDLLYESFVSFLRRAAGSAWRVPLWLLAGRPVLKRELAARASVDPATLPYRAEVVRYLEVERDRGRPVVLATASHRALAEAVAAQVGVFAQVIATDEGPNLKGARKKTVLDEAFGVGGYEYLGDSRADLAVWDGSAAASCVGLSERRLAQVARGTTIARSFEVPPAGAGAWLRALRPVAISKNALVFLPLLLASSAADARLFGVAFACLVLLTASLHILDDLVDLPDDRRSPGSRRPPFADGTLSILAGLGVGGGLAVAASAIAIAALPWPFGALLATTAVVGLVGILFGHRFPGVAAASRLGLDGLRLVSGLALG